MHVERSENTAGKEVRVALGRVSNSACLNAFQTSFVHYNSIPDER